MSLFCISYDELNFGKVRFPEKRKIIMKFEVIRMLQIKRVPRQEINSRPG